MGLWDWFIVKKKHNKIIYWRGKPLYHVGKRVYWKGIPVDDDAFNERVRQNSLELRQYNFWVRKTNRRINHRRLRKRRRNP